MQRCAVDGTVVLTVATSPQYLDSCAELAHTVRMHTPFECLFVALPARLHNAYPSILVPAPLPSWAQQHPVEPVFCERRMSGWRQTHILKTQALLMLLQQGQNVLLLDADRRLLGNPLPAFASSRADVAAMRDEAFLNFGLMYMRSTEHTLKLMARVANRSLAAWDQAILAEELSADSSIACCFANQWIKQCVRIEEAMHRLNKDVMTASQAQDMQAGGCGDSLDDVRVVREGGQGVAARRHDDSSGELVQNPGGAFQTLRPPTGPSRMFQIWHPSRYNALPLANRKYSRCTRTPCRVDLSGSASKPAAALAAAATFLFGTAAATAFSTSGGALVDGGGRICGSSSNDTIFGKRGSRLALSLASSTPATTFNPLAAVARPAHVSPAAPHPNSVDPLLRCTLWPRGTDGLPDAERCARGNSLNDGFQYFYNRNRGTSRAVCGRNAACTCCRRPFEH